MFREVKKIIRPKRAMDGAGVILERVFSHNETDITDPFLMMDYFWNKDPDKQMAGFPWHPHRGIETITYLIKGGIKHEDSMGNSGELKSGYVQWMTAGSGIIHQEMPLEGAGNIYEGFQIWLNLPSANKMMPPRYQDIPVENIPVIDSDDGSIIKIIAGSFGGVFGPVEGIVTEPTYLDIELKNGAEKVIPVSEDDNVLLFIFRGSGKIVGDVGSDSVANKELLILTEGNSIKIKAGDDGIRLILLSAKQLNEPIAWYGSIVMNTEKEIETAYKEYQNGNFIK